MAIVFDGIECPVCKEGIKTDQPFFVSFAFDHPLSDAAMHWSCFYSMTDWESFLDKMFSLSVEGTEKNPYWSIIVKMSNYMVSTNSINVRVTIKPGAISIDLPFNEWPNNLTSHIKSMDLSHLPKQQKDWVQKCLINIQQQV